MGRNPNAANIAGGLSTIGDMSPGAVAKSGSVPIAGVLGTADPAKKVLWSIDQPSYSPESLTGFAAAGAQIFLFSTGLGNSYASALVPTVKISGNRESVSVLTEQIDFDPSPVLDNPDN